MPAQSAYASWLAYFEARSGRELDAPPLGPTPEEGPGRDAVARSVARFELGESGDGQRLRRLAAGTGNRSYARAVELFVEEERQHARWLEILRQRFGGERLSSQWTERAFVSLRHIGGLRRELCVLLIAEVIALTYYRVLERSYDDPVLQATCERILLDERGHVALAGMPGPARTAAVLAWRAFVAATAAVVARDHRAVLALAGVSRSAFERDVRTRARRLADSTHSRLPHRRPTEVPEPRTSAPDSL